MFFGIRLHTVSYLPDAKSLKGEHLGLVSIHAQLTHCIRYDERQ